MRVTQIIAAAVLAAALSLTPSLGSAQQTVRVGQGVPTLSFLPGLGVARAQHVRAAGPHHQRCTDARRGRLGARRARCR